MQPPLFWRKQRIPTMARMYTRLAAMPKKGAWFIIIFYHILSKVYKLLEKADDDFVGISTEEHKCMILKKVQESKYICSMTGAGVHDVLALKKADIGIVLVDATDDARTASDIVLTKPGLSVIMNDRNQQGHLLKDATLHDICNFNEC